MFILNFGMTFFFFFLTIFHLVSGRVLPGQVLGIIGASGSGKTTLLNVLTARNLKGLEVKACIYINGQSVEANEIKKKCAYVQQKDIFMGALTVREHLYLQVRCLFRFITVSFLLFTLVDIFCFYFRLESSKTFKFGQIGP